MYKTLKKIQRQLQVINMQNLNELKKLQDQMALENVQANCQVLVNFFSSKDLSRIDQLIELTSQKRVSVMRSHAIALKVNTDEYLTLLKRNPAKYQQFTRDLALFVSNINYLQNIEPNTSVL